MIEIKNLTKKFRNFVAVNNVSLTINSGECFALLGLNGAGKTTLINMLTTQTRPTSGSAIIDGFDLIKQAEEIKKIINISPQESAVAKNLTVKENLQLVCDLYNIKNSGEQVNNLICQFGLEQKQNEICKKLSGGQLRRLSIALAMITNPKILFLDEPTLGLDVKARKHLWDIIDKLKLQTTIVLTTHYLEEVEHLADKIAIISAGKIKAVGSPNQIVATANAKNLEDAFINLSEEE